MLKVIGMVKRKSGITLEEFSRYWYEKHVPFGQTVIPESLMHKRYIQNHAVKLPGGGEPPYDGVAEIYFVDLAALQRWNKWYFSDDAKPLREDEENFMDRDKTVVVVTDERVVRGMALLYTADSRQNIQGVVKVIAFIKRQGNLTFDEFSRYWYENHAPLGSREIPEEVRSPGYVQNHSLKLPGGGEAPYDGVAEIYWTNLADLQRWNKWYFSDTGKRLREDEECFMDNSKRVIVVTDERVVIP